MIDGRSGPGGHPVLHVLGAAVIFGAVLVVPTACAPRSAAPSFPVDQRISGAPPVAGEVSLRLDQGPADRPSPVFLVQGIDKDRLDRLADDPDACRTAFVARSAEGPGDSPPLAGRYEVDRESASLRFIPDAPLDAGARYRATWGPGGTPPVSAEFVAAPR